MADLADCQSLLAVIGHKDQPKIGNNLSVQPQYFVDQLDSRIVAFKGQQDQPNQYIDQPISSAQPIVPIPCAYVRLYAIVALKILWTAMMINV